MKKVLFALCIIIVYNLSGLIINIPSDYATIQDGIDAAADGDTVLVYPGEYGRINFDGKNIVVGSLFLTTGDESYITSTIISCTQEYIVIFENNETEEAMIKGFSIGEGQNMSFGILCDSASPQIINNAINVHTGAGIRCEGNSSPWIADNSIQNASRGIHVLDDSAPYIYNNHISVPGYNISNWGIMAVSGQPIIDHNVIIGSNYFPSNGILVVNCSDIIIKNNIISANFRGISTGQGIIINNLFKNNSSAVYCGSSSAVFLNNSFVNSTSVAFKCDSDVEATITNCIFWDNGADFYSDTTVYLRNCCIENYIPSNIHDLGGNTLLNPGFIDPDVGNYHLSLTSACIDAGTTDTTGLNLPDYDLEGSYRIKDGNGDLTQIVDIGCYEADTITNPGYISGNIVLENGNGNVVDVLVGAGKPVHPDAQGDYLITIGAGAPQYNVTATLEGYLTQTIDNVEVIAGVTTENVDFLLQPFLQDDYIDFTPDSLVFLVGEEMYLPLKFKNISQTEIIINDISYTVHHDVYFFHMPWTPEFPYVFVPGDSLEYSIYRDLPPNALTRDFYYDSLFVFTDIGRFSLPLLLDTELGIDDPEITIPLAGLQLSNHPNPFNPITMISFILPLAGKTELNIFNIKGQKVKSLVNDFLTSGEHKFIWDGKNNCGEPLSSGVYLCTIKLNENTIAHHKCMLMK